MRAPSPWLRSRPAFSCPAWQTCTTGLRRAASVAPDLFVFPHVELSSLDRFLAIAFALFSLKLLHAQSHQRCTQGLPGEGRSSCPEPFHGFVNRADQLIVEGHLHGSHEVPPVDR